MSDLTQDHSKSSKSSASTQHAGGAPSDALFTLRHKSSGAAEIIRRPSISFWMDAWLRLKKNKIAVASGVYVIALILVAAIGPEVIHYNYEEQEVWNLHQPPGGGQIAVVTSDDQYSYTPVVAEAVPTEAAPIDAAATTEVSYDAPEAPASVELVGDALTTGIVIKWAQVSGADGYRLYRSTEADTDGVPMTDTDAVTLSYQDLESLMAGQTYYYKVFSFNAMGDSAVGTTLEVTPKLAITLLDAQKFAPDAEVGSEVTTPSHYLGTDYLGRDLLARLLTGARISLFIGLVAPLIYIFIGIVYGCVSGYFGGFIDNVMMRIADIITTIPDLLAVIMLQVFLGSGVTTLVIALVMVTWATSARQIRGEVLRLRESEFVYAARVLGTPTYRIILRHLLPNTTGTILVLFTLAIPQAIFSEAFLSFIGLGIKPPMASWGTVVREGAKFFKSYPHEVFIPAVLISVTMFAFNRLGDGMRDALDPRLRGAE
jgi:oligopeptide transport system permease protein